MGRVVLAWLFEVILGRVADLRLRRAFLSCLHLETSWSHGGSGSAAFASRDLRPGSHLVPGLGNRRGPAAGAVLAAPARKVRAPLVFQERPTVTLLPSSAPEKAQQSSKDPLVPRHLKWVSGSDRQHHSSSCSARRRSSSQPRLQHGALHIRRRCLDFLEVF